MTCTHAFARKINQGPNESYLWNNINASSADMARVHFADRIFGLLPKHETQIMPIQTMMSYYDELTRKLTELGSSANLSVMPHDDKEFCKKLESMFGGDKPSIVRTTNGEISQYVGAFEKMHRLFDEWVAKSPSHWSHYAHGKIAETNRNAVIYTGIANGGGTTGRQYASPVHRPQV